MSIRVTCGCGKRFLVREEYAGRRGKCPGCGAPLAVPRPGAPGPEAAHATPPAARPAAPPAPAPETPFAAGGPAARTRTGAGWKAAIIAGAALTLAAVVFIFYGHTFMLGCQARGEGILTDREVFGAGAGTNVTLYEFLKKMSSETGAEVSADLGGGPMARAVGRHGRPEEIRSASGALRFDVYWYGRIGFGVDGEGNICALLARK